MPVTAELKHWLVVLPSDMSQRVRSFVQLIRRVGGSQNFQVPEPR